MVPSAISALPSPPLPLFPRLLSLPPRLPHSSRLHSSKPPATPGGDGGDGGCCTRGSGGREVLYAFPTQPPRPIRGTPLFVALPVDSVGSSGQMTRRKTMWASFLALKTAGVAGVVVECWWGVVEREAPGVYDWSGYADLVAMARGHGLQVRAIMAFHQFGTMPGDPDWIPLPQWVLEEMDKEPDLAYSDRFGHRNREYISLGCDNLPLLKGRSPIQAYSDFMRSFRDKFKDFLGFTITEIQVGMGPAGELRYPSCLTMKPMQASSANELGEFQFFDKYMLASLNACARNVGMQECGYGGFQETALFRSDGSWNTRYGRFFLEWYSGMLLLHGERLCMVADETFRGTSVRICAEVAGIYWHHRTNSYPELTAGYYNTLVRDGYLPIACMFRRHKVTLCCTCFDMQDSKDRSNLSNSPEGLLGPLLNAARMCNLPVIGENSLTRLDDASLNEVVKHSRFYRRVTDEASLSFNYVRMNKYLFESHNWNRFTKAVKQISNAGTFQARLDFKGSESSLFSTSAAGEVGRALVYL